MPKIDLLPCPFCGKPDTAKIITVAECECMDNPTERDKTHYGVVCDNSIEGGCGASTGWNHSTPEEAVKVWNTRASGWISCSERLPKRDGFYLAYYTFADGRHACDMVYFNVGSPISSSITHWMPLPEKPKEVTE